MEGEPVLEEVAFGARDTVALPVQFADAVEVRVGEGEDDTLCVMVRVNCTVTEIREDTDSLGVPVAVFVRVDDVLVEPVGV